MHVGHFAVGLAAKRVEPRISLGTLVLAALLSDLLWAIFLFAGIEHVRFMPGRGAANYADAYDIAFSHSLLMVLIWGALFAAVYFLRRRYTRGALVLFFVVVSHWLLDAIAHRPDMSLAPGTDSFYGLGLWTSLPATLIVEGGLWLLAIILYTRATRPKNRRGVYAFWIVVALLTLFWYNNITGPPPPSARVAGISSLIYFSLVVAWAYWMNRLRPVKD